MNTLIDENLAEVDYRALYQFAEWHEKQAMIMRARAEKLHVRDRQEDEIKARVNFLKKLPELVIKHINKGHDVDKAIKSVSEVTETPFHTVEIRWREFLRDSSHEASRIRNTSMYHMHCIGVKNTIIADIFCVHPVTVSRNLKTEKEKRAIKPPSPHVRVLHNKRASFAPLHKDAKQAHA